LFDYIAKVLGDFLIEKGLAEENLLLGFTFSWTKSFTTTGVIGEDVVKLLEEAIKRDGRVKVEVMAVLNDTVGTIVAGAYETNGKCDLGVIIGTGTNASYMEDTEAIIKGLHDASEPYHHKQVLWRSCRNVERNKILLHCDSPYKAVSRSWDYAIK
uniref:Phosphotransferase n=1 Tax=Haemonchus placei TaxID=6290 RepID=A0A0N4VWG4_HAEPC